MLNLTKFVTKKYHLTQCTLGFALYYCHALRKFFILIGLIYGLGVHAQTSDKGQFSGNLITNYQKYIRDDKIGANTKVYLEGSNSLETWLNMNYRINGYTFTVRYDGFFNSPLLNPIGSFTDHGIGYWQINKKLEKLDLTIGSFYDQLGSGLLFRAYEQRQIGIDYAVQGARAAYEINDHLRVKAFAGNQKGNIDDRFGYAKQVISGANIEGNTSVNNTQITGGLSALNRTLTSDDRQSILETIKGYDVGDRFVPKHNVYGGNAYINVVRNSLSFDLEYVQKSKEAMLIDNVWKNKEGRIIYGAIGWGKSGIKMGTRKRGKKKGKPRDKASIGLNIQARHIDHFVIKTSPSEQLLNGLISYMPSLTKQNTYRLLARYNAPAQEIGENGVQAEIDIKPSRKTKINLNGSYVQSADDNGKNGSPQLLFRELNGQIIQKISRNVKLKLGLQSIEYNQAVYEQEVDYENVKTITPFGELNVKIKPKGKRKDGHKRSSKNLRFEFQVLNTDRDQGSFANAIAEFSFNPKFTLAVGDMVNFAPHRYPNMNITDEILHYPSVFASYNTGKNVFSLAYLKQQAGVNCSGGICRVEPAFSGVRFTMNSNF